MAPRLIALGMVGLLGGACGGATLGTAVDEEPRTGISEAPTEAPTEAEANREPAAEPDAVAAAVVAAAPAPQPAAPRAPEPEPVPMLAAVAAFEPHADDVEHDAKRLAGRFAQAITTYPRGSTPAAVAGAATAAHGGDPAALEAAIAELVHPEAQSVGTVVYPQLGGLTADRTSVMVVVRQELVTADGATRVESRTMDVRLHRVRGAWTLERLAANGGPVTPRPTDLPAKAVRVLDHPRLELADSARWDIHRGVVDPRLLTLMADVADRHTDIGIAVLVTGHPWEVFGTDRMSRHSAGRAFDIYRVDGELIASGRRDGSVTQQLTRWLFDVGVPELGSPWALDGFGGRSFTDAVHQDHLHVAIRA